MSPIQPPVELPESCSDGLAQQRELVTTVSLGAVSLEICDEDFAAAARGH